MGEIISIISGKGGAGKTTLAANLGCALASLHKTVLLIDANGGNPGLDLALGMEKRVVYNINDILDGNCTSTKAMLQHKKQDRLFLIPASRVQDLDDNYYKRFAKVNLFYKSKVDYVIIDGSSEIQKKMKVLNEISDRVLLVAGPDRMSLRNTKRVLNQCEKQQVERINLVINKLRMDLLKNQEIMSPETMLKEIQAPLIGIIPESDDIYLETDKGESVIERKGYACRSFVNIAKRILGEEIPIVLKGRL